MANYTHWNEKLDCNWKYALFISPALAGNQLSGRCALATVPACTQILSLVVHLYLAQRVPRLFPIPVITIVRKYRVNLLYFNLKDHMLLAVKYE